MRILFLAPQPFYRLRGMCIAQRRCLEVFSQLGTRVDLLTFPFGEDVDIPGVSLRRLPPLPGMRDIPIGPSWQKLAMSIPLMLSAAWLCFRNRYPLIHACEEAAFFLAILKPFFGFKLIYDMDDILSARLARSGFMRNGLLLKAVELWERWTLGTADLVVTNSRDTTEYATRFARAGRVLFYDHAPPLPDGSDWDILHRSNFREARGLTGRRVILYAGNLEAYQGIPLLLESLPAVFDRLPDSMCVIIGGEPAQVAELRAALRERGLGERVSVLGKMPLPETFRFMQAADALVSPMTQEKAVPMKLYAYLAAGVPIVATDLPNHTQLLKGSPALLAPPDPTAFAAALCVALDRSGSGGPPETPPGSVPRPWMRDLDARAMGQACLAVGMPARA